MNHEVIMFVSEDDAASYKWEKNKRHLKENRIEVLGIEEISQLEKMGVVFSGNGKPRINSMYVRHPFANNEYVELEQSSDIIQYEKLNNFSVICRLLGAKEIFTEHTSTKIKKSEYAAKLGVSLPQGNGEIELEQERVEENRKKYKLEDTYGEGEFKDLEYAKEFASKRGLDIDKNIVALIRKRDPAYGVENLLKSHSVELTLSNEVNNLLEVAANINSIGNLVSISANYQQKLSVLEEISLKIQVKF